MNICVKKLTNIPSHEIVLFRALVSFLLSYASLKKHNINPWGNHKLYLILRGIFGTLGLLSFFYTIQKIPLATAVTIQYLAPIFSTILAIFILKEHTKIIQWFFFLISFSGVLIIKGFDTRISFFYLVVGVLSALFSGLAYNIIRKLKDFDDPLVAVFYFPLVTIPIIAPYTIMNWQQPYGFDWLYLLMVGILTQQAQFYMTKAYQSEQIAIVSNFSYLGTVYAIFFGYFLFGESIGIMSFTGIFLIMVGVLLSTKFK